ncbi:MAG: PQQ-like beta-propeller repeat protein [Calditrichaeota bacterium]|nr:PQQ-like beta-propeller repeat protein [Calditrichota bacterium]
MRETIKTSFVLVLALVLLVLSCARDKTPLGPAEGPAVCPQQDIPWPSLANSPWPVMWGDMQCTARGKYPGPRIGRVVWSFSQEGLYAEEVGVAIAEDGTLYLAAPNMREGMRCYLFVLGPDGSLRARTFFTGPGECTSSASLLARGRVLAVDHAGAIHEFDMQGNIQGRHQGPHGNEAAAPAVGLDGTVYFYSWGNFFSGVEPSGQVKWSRHVGSSSYSLTRCSLAMSPDGRSFYTLVHDHQFGALLTAFDAHTGSVRWQATASPYFLSPLVDNEGNVYCITFKQGADHFVVRSFTSGGQLRWASPARAGQSTNLCMSSDGYLFAYGAGDSLLCIDCEGRVRWSTPMLGRPELASEGGVRLVVDSEGVVYACYNSRYVLGFGKNGTRLFVCELPAMPYNLCGLAISCTGQLIIVGEGWVYCLE